MTQQRNVVEISRQHNPFGLDGVRKDSDPVALRAFRSMHVEAINFSGMTDAEHAAVLVFQHIRCALGAIARSNAGSNWTGVVSLIGAPERN